MPPTCAARSVVYSNSGLVVTVEGVGVKGGREFALDGWDRRVFVHHGLWQHGWVGGLW